MIGPWTRKSPSRFNDNILHAAMQRYDIAADQIHLLDGFESFIYEFNRPDGDFILRIGHSLRRTPDLIRGEVDWINYLSDGGSDRCPGDPSADREPGRIGRRWPRRTVPVHGLRQGARWDRRERTDQ